MIANQFHKFRAFTKNFTTYKVKHLKFFIHKQLLASKVTNYIFL
jgi:hypothetical protein